jgi:hypothetical protein
MKEMGGKLPETEGASSLANHGVDRLLEKLGEIL